jgi:8-oxo-dGTP pyrophosphatase MutT (NUDIX family)
VATTAVVAEILIVGLEAAAWLVLLALTVFGVGWIDAGSLSDFAALTTIAVIAAAYVLGIVVDRAADSLFTGFRETAVGRWLTRHFGRSTEAAPPASVSTMRLEAMKQGGALAGFLEYQRSRLRVIRGTALNLAIGAPIAFAFLWRNAEPWQAAVTATLLLVGAAVSLPVAVRIRTAHLERLADAYRLLVPPDEAKAKRRRDAAAAVTYGFVGGGPRFLLVRTTGGRHWTFPKGKVEKGETAPAAALREAHEEAGVTGELDEELVTTYRYPARHGERDVHAYLLRADPEAELARGEDGREPRWTTPSEARRLLAKRRDERYAAEHARVLDEALARIERAHAERARSG